MSEGNKTTDRRINAHPNGHVDYAIGQTPQTKTTQGVAILVGLSVLVAALVLAAYWPVLKCDFVKYDDDKYLTENKRITGGITRESLTWVFTNPHYHMWHPLTSLSYMLDCHLFGLAPAWHHLTSLLLHTANTLLLFWVLTRMTRALWPSAFVAAVFALHPLQVESVAWIAERKNVLSGLFWMLTIGAYLRYAERPSAFRFLFVILVFALCIMTKPMVVTLPCVLLLLDYWPLGRLQSKPNSEPDVTLAESDHLLEVEPVERNCQQVPLWRLIVEKIPLFVLAAILSVITYNFGRSGGVVSALEKLTLKSRIANALISYLTYIEKLIWPSQLAVFYPHPVSTFSVVRVVISAGLLALLTILFLYFFRRRRYLAVGWLWYLGTLVPVIGLVQAGAQARADRYMYVTMIGLLIIIAWAVKDLVAKWRAVRVLAVLAGAVVLPVATVCTRFQLRHWKDSAALFKRALDVTTNNSFMHNNYANLLGDAGRIEEAAEHYQKALKLIPHSAEVHNNLGNALVRLGRIDDAIQHYRRALTIEPSLAVAHCNLAGALADRARPREAIAEYRLAIRFKPDYAEAWGELGFLLANQGRFNEAVDSYTKAIEFRPNFIVAHGRLGLALAALGRNDEAIEQFRIVLSARPDDFEMHFNVAVLLELQGETPEAISHYRRALQINPHYTEARDRLEAALKQQKSP